MNLKMSSPKKLTVDPNLKPAVIMHEPASPRFSFPGTPTAGAKRKVAIAVDLSDESAHAVKWAVQNYLRPGDAVILLHIRPTSVLYGADWGGIIPAELAVASEGEEESKQKLEDDFDNFTTMKSNKLAQPLVDAKIPFKIRIVKDHDMMERLCLEVERLGLSTLIMGSRGFGAAKGRLGSFSDYCVHHCVCPVVVVRSPDEDCDIENSGENKTSQEAEYHDPLDTEKDMEKFS